MSGALGVAVGVVGLLFGIVLVVALSARAALVAMRKPLEARVRRRYGDAPLLAVDYRANSFGLESLGVLQARGNGALVVTSEEIRFLQLVPERDFVIPTAALRQITRVHRHLGKSTTFPLLKLQFDGPEGPDSIAFLVARPDELAGVIEAVKDGRTH